MKIEETGLKMKNTIQGFPVLFILAAIFMNCSDATAPNSNEIPQLPRQLSKSEQALIESSNTFGFDLFKKLSNDVKDSNLLGIIEF